MNPILALSICAFLVALSMVSFAFYYLGKNKTITVSYSQIVDLFILTLIIAIGDPASNYLQTIGIIIFSYLATATINYIVGYASRPVTSVK